MIVDAFIFNNEFDILKARIDYLKDVVDYFVIVESNTTFTGNRKKLLSKRFIEINYLNIKSKFLIYENFKEIKTIEDLEKNDYPFKKRSEATKKLKEVNKSTSLKKKIALNETFQRELLNLAINKFIINEQAIIIISDVDEIPNYDFIEKIKNIENDKLYYAGMEQYIYSPFYKLEEKWIGSVSFRKNLINKKSIYYLRFMPKHFNVFDIDHKIIINSGWHFTSFGSLVMIREKINSWGHWELNTFINKLFLEFRINRCFDIFGRDKKIYYLKDIDKLPDLIMSKFLNKRYLNTFKKPNKLDIALNIFLVYFDRLLRRIKYFLK